MTGNGFSCQNGRSVHSAWWVGDLVDVLESALGVVDGGEEVEVGVS